MDILDIAIDTIANYHHFQLCVGFFMISLGVFPLWWSYFSEIGGRRGVYLSSFVLFICMCAIGSLSCSLT